MALKLQRTGERSNTPTCAVSFKRLLDSNLTVASRDTLIYTASGTEGCTSLRKHAA
jgi:hypothetical protein